MSMRLSADRCELSPAAPGRSQPAHAVDIASSHIEVDAFDTCAAGFHRAPRNFLNAFIAGIKRRWRRERRRRKVGRAYDMALEIARFITPGTEVLDVGCGDGFIAHHLSAMLGTSVLGIDLANNAEAPIDYRRFDGARFPLPDSSVDAVLLCYVLHHAQDVNAVLHEVARVLRFNGLAIIYEDVPQSRWDKLVCRFHNQQWQARTGPCLFRRKTEWEEVFSDLRFEVLYERRLSRWRNVSHAVSRRLYVLKPNSSEN